MTATVNCLYVGGSTLCVYPRIYVPSPPKRPGANRCLVNGKNSISQSITHMPVTCLDVAVTSCMNSVVKVIVTAFTLG